MKVVLRPDGASRGNPGPAAVGVVVEDASGRVLREVSEAIGQATNNVAEYRALLRGLEEARKLGAREVEIRTDSELVARQLLGQYRVRDPELRPLFESARRQLATFDRVSVRSVPRSENARSDWLARQALQHPGDSADAVVETARRGEVGRALGALRRMSPEQVQAVAERLVRELARSARQLQGGPLFRRAKMEAGAGRAAAPPEGGEESPGSTGQGGG